jgi:DNA-binding SARP family transcriptional activator
MAHQGLVSHNGSGMRRETIRIRLLGGFALSVGPRTVDAGRWRLKKAMSLVKLLALAPRHRLHRERVADVLWPGVDAKRASNNLHRTLHSARGVLSSTGAGVGSNYLVLREDLLQLCPDSPIWVDVDAFENAAAEATGSLEPAAFRVAISLYAGDLLPENLYEDWAEERREGLRRSYGALLVELGALYEKRGEYEKGIQTLKSVVGQESAPDEEAHARLMRLFALSGRRLEALRLYERLRDRLFEELGVHPADATTRLYDALRAGSVPVASPPTPGPKAANNLPLPLTSFVGRGKEVLGVERSLSMTRLMTLTGAGGSGKPGLRSRWRGGWLELMHEAYGSPSSRRSQTPGW